VVFGKTTARKYIAITRQAADGIITYSRTKHPNEAILVLQGKSNKDHLLIDRLVIPPFSMSGPYYSGFPIHDLPLVSLIISHPYEDDTLGAFDRNGDAIELKILESQ
jgi:hypothetical protein